MLPDRLFSRAQEVERVAGVEAALRAQVEELENAVDQAQEAKSSAGVEAALQAEARRLEAQLAQQADSSRQSPQSLGITASEIEAQNSESLIE